MVYNAEQQVDKPENEVYNYSYLAAPVTPEPVPPFILVAVWRGLSDTERKPKREVNNG